MYTNIIINKVAKYVPKKMINNAHFIKHFKNEGKECEGLLNAFKRDTRYFADDSESSISMGLHAAKKALKDIDRSSIDMVIFVSCTPEYNSQKNRAGSFHALACGEECGILTYV